MDNSCSQHIVIIGAGMAGLSSSISLLELGYKCTILEAKAQPGGLAGNFTISDNIFPLGYHHILANDQPLLDMIDKMKLSDLVHWKKGKVFFAVNNTIYNLENLVDFLRFPLPIYDKVKFVLFMLMCFVKKDWSEDLGDAKQWVDSRAGVKVRKLIFDPLMNIKYGLPSDCLSANWLGSRLHYREFSKPLGYIPNTDWTHVLVDAMVDKVKSLGGVIKLESPVTSINYCDGKFKSVSYSQANKMNNIDGVALINTAPPHIFSSISELKDEQLTDISYLDALSVIMEINEKMPRDYYLLSCLSPKYSFGGIFTLSSVNEQIGVYGKTVINFFTTLSEQNEHLRNLSKEDLVKVYLDDFEKLFNFRPKPLWSKINLINNYSPRYLKGYSNPSIKSSIGGVYFAGNYRTYPLITSTGSAILSGIKAGRIVSKDIPIDQSTRDKV